MTIHDPAAYCAGLWDWGILRGCFGDTAIAVTDIDGLVERNGLFLVLETKRLGASVPEGQMRMFKRFAASGLFTVFVIWGDANQPRQIQTISVRGINPPRPCNLNQLRKAVNRWFQWAEGPNGKL